MAGSFFKARPDDPSEFAEKCLWTRLDGSDWAELLAVRPAFSDKCRWKTLKDRDWMNKAEHLWEAACAAVLGSELDAKIGDCGLVWSQDITFRDYMPRPIWKRIGQGSSGSSDEKAYELENKPGIKLLEKYANGIIEDDWFEKIATGQQIAPLMPLARGAT